MANFADVLNEKLGEVEKPEPIPTGTYLCAVDGVPELAEVGADQNKVVNFKLKLLQAMEDVDREDFEKAKPLGMAIRHSFFYENQAGRFALQTFLKDHLGVTPGMSLKQALDQTPGRQCKVAVKHQMSQDRSQVYANVKGTAAL